MTRELPTFDSVWIDALVQSRKITPFQARVLESSNPRQLRMGPCLLVDQLSSGVHSQTFLAQFVNRKERCVLKVIETPPEISSSAFLQIKELISRSKDIVHPSLILPYSCQREQGQLVTVSRYLPGPSLHDLLIRRGRFPADVVQEIGRQLIEASAVLESQGVVHGEIRLSNIRISTGGIVVLVDCGVTAAVFPQLNVTAGIPPERFEATAPELVSSSNVPNSISDLYSVGCVLSQLLTGRPPFPTGDPLAKLASHQTRKIDDVRTWAPDTPDGLADAIGQLVAKKVNERPQSYREAAELWSSFSRPRKQCLKRFRATFETNANRLPARRAERTKSPLMLLAAMIFAISGISFSLFDSGARTQLLSWIERVPSQISKDQGGYFNQDVDETTSGRPDEDVQESTQNRNQFLALPAPGPDGVIHLLSSGPYEATEISTVGPLVILGDQEASPVIIVRDKPMKIWAEKLSLHHVTLRGIVGGQSESQATSLLLVQSQNLEIQGCRFERETVAHVKSEIPVKNDDRLFIGWKTMDSVDQTGGHLQVSDTVFWGLGTGVYLVSLPRSIECNNCLKIGSEALFNLSQMPRPSQILKVDLSHLTLRESGGLFSMEFVRDSQIGQMQVEAENCVFAFKSATSALMQFVSDSRPEKWAESFSFSGSDSLIKSGSSLVGWLNRRTSETVEFDQRKSRVEGLVAIPFQFVGPVTGVPSDSAIGEFSAPRTSAEPPGIIAARLP
jgi:serine/threonine protein kinase